MGELIRLSVIELARFQSEEGRLISSPPNLFFSPPSRTLFLLSRFVALAWDPFLFFFFFFNFEMSLYDTRSKTEI